MPMSLLAGANLVRTCLTPGCRRVGRTTGPQDPCPSIGPWSNSTPWTSVYERIHEDRPRSGLPLFPVRVARDEVFLPLQLHAGGREVVARSVTVEPREPRT